MNATPEKKTSVRAAEAVLIAGIAAMMLFPLAGMFFGFRASGALGEKRTLKEWPAWSWDSTAIRQWPRDVEAFLDDRFAMRDRLIRWHHRFCYFTLGFSPQPAVVKGRDGWLFYNSAEKNNGDEMSDCLGSRPLTAAELDRLTREFKRRSDWLRQKGIPFLIIVAPNKSTIYREHLPPGMSPRGPSPLEQLSAAMTNFPGVNFFDPMPLLLAAKKEKQVYYQTDTHWNDEGAFRVYRESISRARAAGIKVEAPEISDYKTTRIVDAPGYDLSVMLGIDDLVEQFPSKFSMRNPLNIPGPIYGAETDTCCSGPREAPENVLLDKNGQEFVFKQASNAREFRGLVSAAICGRYARAKCCAPRRCTPSTACGS